MINIILIIVGFFFLVKGADFLIDGSTNIARRLKISEFLIGLTVVAIGTSIPELVVSIKSVFNKYDNLLMGNLLGSCINNFLLVLGVMLVIKDIETEKIKFSNMVILVLSILIVALFGNMYQIINRMEGIFLLLFFNIFLIMISFDEKKNTNNHNKVLNKESIIKSFILFIIGISLLKIGGDLVVDKASRNSKNFQYK